MFTVGNLDGSQHTDIIQIPGLLSFLGTGHFDGTIQGIDQLRAEYKQTYGQDPGAPYYSPGDYTPVIAVTYWTFRLMIGMGLLCAAVALLVLYATRRGRAPTNRWWARLAILLPLLPVAANSFGWIFTEMGRQPWVVFGLMTTANGVSPSVGAGLVATSLITFTLLYAALAVVEVGLLVKTIRQGLPDVRRFHTAGRWRRRPPAGLRVLRRATMELTTVWFILIAVLWIGYFTLEGFDFGVGMLLPILAHDDRERRVLINTIGPVWDGNEVWLLVAGGATFAAFPNWYATLFSGFYLPLLLILLALIVRGVAFEYRAKRHREEWRGAWDIAIVVGSFVPAFLWGVAFANILRGVPIDADMEYTGGFFNLLNPYALLGGATTLLLFLTHGAMYVALKTDGPIRVRARSLALQSRPGGGCRGGRVPALDAGRYGQRRLGRVLRARRGLPGRRAPRGPAGSGGLGLHRHLRLHRPRRGRPVHRAVPRRHAELDGHGLQPDHDQRLVDALHAGRDDRGRSVHHAVRPRLPGVDLLGVPQADLGAPHPRGASRGCSRMRPTDPRLVRRLAPARRPLTGVIVGGVVTSLLLIGQAWLVAGLVVAVVDEHPVLPWALAVAGIFAARGLVGLLAEVFAARAAGVVGADVRREVLRAVLSPSSADRPQAGETAVLGHARGRGGGAVPHPLPARRWSWRRCCRCSRWS